MRFGIVLAFLFLFLVGSFVSSMVAPGPSCNVEGVIKNVTYSLEWKHSCLMEPSSNVSWSYACPDGGRLSYPERYEVIIQVITAENRMDIENDFNKDDCMSYIKSNHVSDSFSVFIPVSNLSNASFLKVGNIISFSMVAVSWREVISSSVSLVQPRTFNLSNGRVAEIKVMPETASEKAIERLGQLNFSVVLKEVGRANNPMVVYEIRGKKQGKFLGLFKVKGNVAVQVSVESGAIITTKRPWWSFLASGI